MKTLSRDDVLALRAELREDITAARAAGKLISLADLRAAAYGADLAALDPDARAAVLETIASGENANTMASYEKGWRAFQGFCFKIGEPALPASEWSVAYFLAKYGPAYDPNSLHTYLQGVNTAHRIVRAPNPVTGEAVRQALRGLYRLYGKPDKGKDPLMGEDFPLIVEIARAHRNQTKSTRDVAMIATGLTTGMRRSEVVGVDFEHVQFFETGYVVTVFRSKSDQEGHGYRLPVARDENESVCPVRALERWIELLPDRTGPIFRPVHASGDVLAGRLSPPTYGLVVKEYARALGYDERNYAGHSTRAGMVTSLFESDVPDAQIMEQSRHEDIRTMRRYVRPRALVRERLTAKIFHGSHA